MYNIIVNRVPKERWMNERGLKLIDDFNSEAKKNGAKLILSMYNEPETMEHLDFMLQEGQYEFIYSSKNPHSEELKAMIEEADNCARYIYFETSDLMI